jgi:hypothetical protein
VGRITVANTGTSTSGNFEIDLIPDTNTKAVADKEQESGLAGGATQTYDLLAYVYPQEAYFKVPSTSPIAGLPAAVQLVGGAGMGVNSSRSSSFTLQNRPFHALAPVRINAPVVTQPWTSYQQQVGVQPGDIVTIIDAGGCVQTGASGRPGNGTSIRAGPIRARCITVYSQSRL